MLILNKEKEDLLVSKFNFIESYSVDNDKFYKYKKCLTISASTHSKFSCNVYVYSTSKMCLDMLYDLIKDDVLIKIPNENLVEKRKNSLKNQIEILSKKLKELENKNDNNKNR